MAFGILGVELVAAVALAFFEFDFSASSPLSESESLLSEESDESLGRKNEHFNCVDDTGCCFD